MDKVSFQEAAKQAGVHFNTVKNWRKSGKLKTAQKVLENGHELWLIDPAEVVQVARQARQNFPESPDNNVVDLGENKVDKEQPEPDRTADLPPVTQSGQALSPALEQNLIFFRESIVRPLVEDLARARTELGEAKEEIGTLKERVRQLEADQAAARAVQAAPKPTATVDITPKPEPAPEPPPRRIFGFFKRKPKAP